MKKFITFSIIVLGTMFVNAQTKEEIQKSQERYEKILKLETPKSTSISSLDELTVNVGATAVESANITPLLQNLYIMVSDPIIYNLILQMNLLLFYQNEE